MAISAPRAPVSAPNSAPVSAPVSTPTSAPPAPAAAGRRINGAPAIRLNPTQPPAPPTGIAQAAAELLRNPGSGEALPPVIKAELESSLNVPLYPVRVHSDPRTAAVVDGMGARAFTYGLHVFLGSRARVSDLELMAHEVTHVVQQQGKPVLQMATDQPEGATENRYEREAGAVASAVTQGQPATVRERTSPQVQGIWPVDEVAEWAEEQGWDLLNEYAPDLVPIVRQGPVEWLREKISAAVETITNTLMGPVRAVTGVAATLSGHFTNLMTWMREAAARIARNDCGPIREAAEKIQQIFEGFAAPIIERLRQLIDKAKTFFTGLWDRFGAPVWQFLQRIGGVVWDNIQKMGRWIWEKTAPIRRVLSRAWTWIKNKLGVGEGPEGQDGILQWFQRKAQYVWDTYLGPFIEKYKKPLLIVGAVLVMLSPAGPIIAITAAVAGVAVGIRWIRQNIGTNGVVSQRQMLERVIIPGIVSGVNRATSFLREKARWIADKLTAVVTGLNQAVGAVAGSILNFAVDALNWLVARFQELVNWALNGLLGLVELIASGLARLVAFLQPVLDFLRRVAAVVANVMRLPIEFGSRIWNLIPACIRDPFIDFIIPLILRQIAFFRELAATPEAWRQTRTQIMTLIRQVFRNFDLMGAIRTAFRIVVRALRIPVDLIGQLLDKAARAWDAVLAAPMRFIESAFKAILMGVGGFMRNILSHLWYGVQGWLLNAVSESGVAPPASWTPSAIFFFVLDILGISIDHVIDLIDRRVPGAGRPLRTGVRLLSGALQWLRVAIEQGPRGLWNHLVQSLSNLGTIVLESAVSWIMTRVIAIVSARLAALAASAGLTSVLEAVKAVYDAIQTAIEYMPRILAILIKVFDTVIQLAGGVIGPAAQMVESGMRMAMPVIIGFLANYAGLGGIGGRIREIVLDVRARVDAAILGLIDRAIAAIQSVLALIRRGVQAIRNWWQQRKEFTTLSGDPHSLYFQGQDENADIIMASNPPPASVLQRIRDRRADTTNPPTPPQQAALRNAEGTVRRIKSLISTHLRTSRAGGATSPETASIEPQIETELTTLAQELKDGDIAPSNVRLSNITYSMRGALAGTVTGRPLTKLAGNTSGSTASSRTHPTIWNMIPADHADYWKRIHLVSAAYHGPAQDWNIAVGRGTMNSAMDHDVERNIQKLLARNVEVEFIATVGYWPHNPAKPFVVNFARSITVQWNRIGGNPTPGSDVQISGSEPIADSIEPDFTARGKPDLSTTHEFTILKNALDSQVLASAVQATQPYSGFDDFKRKMIRYFAGQGFGNDFGGVVRKLIARTAEYQFKGSPFSASELIALQEIENYYRQNGSTLGMP